MIMTLQDIAKYRLAVQHIVQADFEHPEDVVRCMGAMQAQDYPGAKWAIGLRTKHVTEADIEQAVRDRKILRTWPQRGTIHFVVPEEVRWRLMLSTPRILAGAKRRHENLNLTEADFAKARELVYKALQGDTQLSRPAMMRVLEDGGIATAGQRGYHILWYLAQTGHLCFGPLEGKQVTFALLDEWVPTAPEIPREEAVQRLVEKYFVSHGPATVHDLGWWSGLALADIRRGIELAGSSLATVEADGKTYFLAANTPEPPKDHTAFLLPGFDEYMLGYQDRSAAIGNNERYIPPLNGVFAATIVIDGQIAGTWKRSARKHANLVELAPFQKLTNAQKTLIESALARYKKFLAAD